MQSLLIGAIIIGLVHGLDPGHGWPIAVIYSTSRSGTTITALISSNILSFAQIVSSIAVVIVLIGVKMFSVFESKIGRYQEHLPKISGDILLPWCPRFCSR